MRGMEGFSYDEGPCNGELVKMGGVLVVSEERGSNLCTLQLEL
jgi:hypothetical protein